MKPIITFACFSLLLLVGTNLSEVLMLTDKELETLSKVNFEALPAEIRQFMASSLLVTTPNKKCCLHGDVYDIITNSRLESFTIVGTFVQRHSHGCGLFNSKTCYRYSTGYTTQVAYQQIVWYTSTPRPCPIDKKTCCKGYIPITSEHCITLEQATANTDLVLQILAQSGK